MTRRALLERHYPESRFGGFSRLDGTIAFYVRVNALAERAITILDVGCGRGSHEEDAVALRQGLRDLRAAGRTVIGIDVDPEAGTNKFIDEFRLLREQSWPIENACIDLCFADCVLEHVSEPKLFFSEARRVLRTGGYLCIRTTNLWSYVALASRLVPNRMHAKVLQTVQDRREERDVFPTTYNCNTVRAIRRELADHGFEGVVYGHEAEPSYLGFSSLAYLVGVLHQRLAPSFLAPTLFAFAKAV